VRDRLSRNALGLAFSATLSRQDVYGVAVVLTAVVVVLTAVVVVLTAVVVVITAVVLEEWPSVAFVSGG
jgi:hypothetical protein